MYNLVVSEGVTLLEADLIAVNSVKDDYYSVRMDIAALWDGTTFSVGPLVKHSERGPTVSATIEGTGTNTLSVLITGEAAATWEWSALIRYNNHA